MGRYRKDEAMREKKGTSHTDQLKRLNRIEGQVRGVAKMIEDQRYCTDILTQLRAIKSAIASVEVKVVEQHMKHCLKKALSTNDQVESHEIVNEIIGLLQTSLK